MSSCPLSQIPLFEALKPHQNILLSGAGGGFDIFSGLPIYFALIERGHNVWLANYTFTDISGLKSMKDELPIVEVTAESDGPTYFPEKYLSHWLGEHLNERTPVYTLRRTGVQPLRTAFDFLVERHAIGALVLVDGGTDSLMRGDEPGLGTPVEDLTSIAAGNLCKAQEKLLVCLGFGVDTYHGVCHHYFLEAVAALARQGNFLGCFSLLSEMKETYLLKQAADYVHSQMPENVSIVVTSILNATLGKFGDIHATDRTRGSHLYINPLMSLYWSFRLEGVAERCLYLGPLEKTHSISEVQSVVRQVEALTPSRPWKELPV